MITDRNTLPAAPFEHFKAGEGSLTASMFFMTNDGPEDVCFLAVVPEQ